MIMFFFLKLTSRLEGWNYRVFNKEGYKVNAYYATKKLISGLKKVHSFPNLITFENLHQGF